MEQMSLRQRDFVGTVVPRCLDKGYARTAEHRYMETRNSVGTAENRSFPNRNVPTVIAQSPEIRNSAGIVVYPFLRHNHVPPVEQLSVKQQKSVMNAGR